MAKIYVFATDGEYHELLTTFDAHRQGRDHQETQAILDQFAKQLRLEGDNRELIAIKGSVMGRRDGVTPSG